jgi:hypothetical protein
MDRLAAPDDWLTRLVIQRGLGLVYLVAFVVAVNQFRPLLGERGLLPVPRFLRSVSFRAAPSLFHIRYSDGLLLVVAWTGVVGAIAVVVGLPESGPTPVSMLVWFGLWALYLSIVNVGQIFYGFGWESLLCEAGFLAIFLGSSSTAPPVIVLWLFRWLAFRVEFGAGLIKVRGDRCWRDLTCLVYHHETQPMPNPLSWYFHHLPRPLHRVEVLGNHFAQLVAPFGLFAPQPVAEIAATIMLLTQAWLVLSGNFAWLNALTMVIAASAVSGSWVHRVLPVSPPDGLPPSSAWHAALVIALAVLVAALSWWPVRNLVSRGQLMNTSFNTLHLVNSYGAFGSVTRVRREVVIQGTHDAELGPDTAWHAYEFKGKPGDPRRRPPQVAPYHLRLDWLMWFAAISPSYARSWFMPLLVRLLEGDRATLRLLRVNPFAHAPPRHVRAQLYRYRFTTWGERRATGCWWSRELIGEFASPVQLRRDPDPVTGALSKR